MIPASRNGPCNAIGAALVVAATGVVGIPALAETGQSVLVVLDASGSMNQPLVEGRTRLEARRIRTGWPEQAGDH
jgi:hypothetical protein